MTGYRFHFTCVIIVVFGYFEFCSSFIDIIHLQFPNRKLWDLPLFHIGQSLKICFSTSCATAAYPVCCNFDIFRRPNSYVHSDPILFLVSFHAAF
jgi:hypothetical protein